MIINPFKIEKKMYNFRNRLIGSFLFLIYRCLGKYFNYISIIDNKTKKISNSKLFLFKDTGEVLKMFEGNEKLITKNFFRIHSHLFD